MSGVASKAALTRNRNLGPAARCPSLPFYGWEGSPKRQNKVGSRPRPSLLEDLEALKTQPRNDQTSGLETAPPNIVIARRPSLPESAGRKCVSLLRPWGDSAVTESPTVFGKTCINVLLKLELRCWAPSLFWTSICLKGVENIKLPHLPCAEQFVCFCFPCWFERESVSLLDIFCHFEGKRFQGRQNAKGTPPILRIRATPTLLKAQGRKTSHGGPLFKKRLLAGAQQGMRNGMTPRETIQLVVSFIRESPKPVHSQNLDLLSYLSHQQGLFWLGTSKLTQECGA